MKTKINSSDFAQRLGAYSHGYKVDLGNADLIFTTGQIALDKNGEVVSPAQSHLATSKISYRRKTTIE